jgi:alkaline phosphatase
MKNRNTLLALAIAGILATGAESANALTISRLTPPSQLFATNGVTASPMISRFIQGQRFDLQATVRPDAGQTITQVEFFVDGLSVGVANAAPVAGVKTSLVPATAITATVPGAVAASVRGYSNLTAGVRALTAVATQSGGATVTATGNFEVVGITQAGRKVKNVIIMLGDGMGSSHRTAARIVQNGYSQGKTNKKLAMDSLTNTAMIMTASLDTIVTDSAPGMANYVTGNKANSGQEGVWPDDTTAAFDGPRMEYMSEFLARTQGKKLGIVTTADVFDATPAANAIHTSNRGNGTGIVDQFLDDAGNTNLTVLMGGGRKWFLPSPTTITTNATTATTFNGSARADSSDYTMPADIQAGWNAAPGALDKTRDLIANFQSAGWTYAADNTALNGAGTPAKLLGLFSLSNMNIAKDKMDGRRGVFPATNAANTAPTFAGTTVVQDYGFPDQPMLDEMATKAIQVLDANSPNGFVLMVEGASIDKQAHVMDSTRFIVDTIEFDKAVQKAKDYVDGTGDFAGHPHADTLVYVTADHECSGAAVIGASTKTDAALQTAVATLGDTRELTAAATLGQPLLRNSVVGNYAAAGFPKYAIAADGYPQVWDPDFKLLVGYGAGGDRYENFRTRPYPTNDTQQPGDTVAPLNLYPRNNISDSVTATPNRPLQQADGYFVTGQVPGDQAVHTGGDIPLTAYGRGAGELGGTIDNTDVFFAVMKAVVGGTTK